MGVMVQNKIGMFFMAHGVYCTRKAFFCNINNMCINYFPTFCHQCFDAVDWVTGRSQEGHPAWKSSATTIPKSLFLWTGLTCSNLSQCGETLKTKNEQKLCVNFSMYPKMSYLPNINPVNSFVRYVSTGFSF